MITIGQLQGPIGALGATLGKLGGTVDRTIVDFLNGLTPAQKVQVATAILNEMASVYAAANAFADTVKKPAVAS